MTTYTAIPDADIDTDSPITQSLMTLLRDNPLGIQEGASGAPRIVRGAIAAGVGHRWFFDYGDESDGTGTTTWTTSSKAPGLYQFEELVVSASNTVTLSAMGPLIICATTSITINGTLDVDGQGARGGEANSSADGDVGQAGMFGGSGGGGDSGSYDAADGGPTLFTPGGNGATTPTAGSSQSSNTKNLLLALMPLFHVHNILSEFTTGTSGGLYNDSQGDCAVGGGGGGAGGNFTTEHAGAGGGVVVLCAPTITVGAAGVITADGTVENAEGGGGGGGAIIIATPTGGYTNNGSVAANGGTPGGAGAAGGAGWVEAITLT